MLKIYPSVLLSLNFNLPVYSIFCPPVEIWLRTCPRHPRLVVGAAQTETSLKTIETEIRCHRRYGTTKL